MLNITNEIIAYVTCFWEHFPFCNFIFTVNEHGSSLLPQKDMLIIIFIFDVYYKFCESITTISYTKFIANTMLL
jgi:hypothetical protein